LFSPRKSSDEQWWSEIIFLSISLNILIISSKLKALKRDDDVVWSSLLIKRSFY
jgi:hypothetical protein